MFLESLAERRAKLLSLSRWRDRNLIAMRYSSMPDEGGESRRDKVEGAGGKKWPT
jgi:hypothetical protein